MNYGQFSSFFCLLVRVSLLLGMDLSKMYNFRSSFRPKYLNILLGTNGGFTVFGNTDNIFLTIFFDTMTA